MMCEVPDGNYLYDVLEDNYWKKLYGLIMEQDWDGIKREMEELDKLNVGMEMGKV